MPDQDLGDLLRSASPLPSGLPEEARHRLERLAAVALGQQPDKD